MIPEFEIAMTQYPDLKPYPNRPLKAIRRVVIHHTGVTGEGEQEALERIYYLHTRTNRWEGIGFHAVVFPSGQLYVTGQPHETRASVVDQNGSTLEICLAGNFDYAHPSDNQIGAINAYLTGLATTLGRSIPIVGHNDLFTNTHCPGYTWDLWRVNLRMVVPDTDETDVVTCKEGA